MEPVGAAARLGVEVTRVEPRGVHLADGTALEGDAVIDGRGDPGGESLTVAFQKFVGTWLELERDHDLECPILMDATVEQRDGFRFVYTLPFDGRTVHVEDTRYSDTPEMDRPEYRREIRQYVESMGWNVRRELREEQGVLPIVLGGCIEEFWDGGAPGVPRSGLRAALFHPTTGYSLPEAVRLADDLARFPDLRSESLYPWIRARSLRLWRRGGFFRLLNRMLFRAADPDRRFVVLQRFYGLSEPLIRRFYAGRLTAADRIRILVGRPPVPVSRALACLVDGGKSR
jgi:lycopene beta-cyclase